MAFRANLEFRGQDFRPGQSEMSVGVLLESLTDLRDKADLGDHRKVLVAVLDAV